MDSPISGSDLFLQHGAESIIEVHSVQGNVYMVYDQTDARTHSGSDNPSIKIDEVEGDLLLMSINEFDRATGNDKDTRGIMIRGCPSIHTNSTSSKDGTSQMNVTVATCDHFIAVHQSFGSCDIRRVRGNIIAVIRQVPRFLSIGLYDGRFYNGLRGGELPEIAHQFLRSAYRTCMCQYVSRIDNTATTLPSRPRASTLVSEEPSQHFAPQALSPVQIKAEDIDSLISAASTVPAGVSAVQSEANTTATSPQMSGQSMCREFYHNDDGVPENWNQEPHTVTCANCHERGHQVRECVGPVNDMGFISGCPVCNTRKHRFELCPWRQNVSSERRTRFEYEMLVFWRQNKPPIATDLCWIKAWKKTDKLHDKLHDKLPVIVLPIPANEALGDFRIDWRLFDYRRGYGNPSLNLFLLPLRATAHPMPGSESLNNHTRKQKLLVKQAQAKAQAQASKAKGKVQVAPERSVHPAEKLRSIAAPVTMAAPCQDTPGRSAPGRLSPVSFAPAQESHLDRTAGTHVSTNIQTQVIPYRQNRAVTAPAIRLSTRALARKTSQGQGLLGQENNVNETPTIHRCYNMPTRRREALMPLDQHEPPNKKQKTGTGAHRPASQIHSSPPPPILSARIEQKDDVSDKSEDGDEPLHTTVAGISWPSSLVSSVFPKRT